MTLEYLHQACYHSKKYVSVECLKAKGVWKTDRKRLLPESILNNFSCAKNGLHHSGFPANFLKVFKKRQTAA